MKQVILARVYAPPDTQKNFAVLIDRLWPRGLRKEDAPFDHWWKDIAPTTALRRWYDHDASKWNKFKEKYLAELNENPLTDTFFAALNQHEYICLMTATKDLKLSHGQILLEILSNKK